MPLLDDILQRLQDQAVGTRGTDLFAGWMPESPDACIAVYEYAGREPERTFTATPTVRRPRVQAVIRAAKEAYAAAESKARSVWSALESVVGVTINGKLYHSVMALQDPFFLRRDEKERIYFVCNFEVTREV